MLSLFDRHTTVLILVTLFISTISLRSNHINCKEDFDTGHLFHQLETSASEPLDTEGGGITFDGFEIDPDLTEAIDEERKESAAVGGSASGRQLNHETSTRHPFEKVCPIGYFACSDGECIAAKWRCDGHLDCDDFSDELNCTTIDMPAIGHHEYTNPIPHSLSTNLSDIGFHGLDFNSTVEPLMIFSTGNSIRGLWMKSHMYFDIVSLNPKLVSTNNLMPQSITQAFSIFFDLFNAETSHTSPVSSAGPGASGSSGTASKIVDSDSSSSKPKSTIVGVDMDPNNKEVYWVELGKDPGVYAVVIEDEQFESRQRRQFHGHRKVVEFGLLAPEDIALDNVAKNAYITDAGLPAIVVCSLAHSHCKIIAHDNLHKPRAIIADSSTGWVTYTDWGDHPGIYLISMDGKQRETLIDTDVVWPNGLAADHDESYLYWADARLKKIERVNLITKQRQRIIEDGQTNPFSVAVFENRIYWSDWAGSKIKTCNKFSGNKTRNIMNAEDIYGIHIYHPDLHRNDIANPCWSKHCSHLCLISPNSGKFSSRRPGSVGATCACPDSMALSVADKSTCYEVHLSFMLVNEKNYIAQVFPERIGLRVVEEIIYTKDHAIQDVAADWISYRLFFFDASSQVIYSADLSGRIPSVKKIVHTGKIVRGLLYDTWSNNLHWLDTEAGTLMMYSFKGKFVKTLRNNLDRPASLVLDSRNRVFYISSLGNKPQIVRANLRSTGTTRADLTLVDVDIGLPVALYIDEQMQRLYWADAKRETIESIDLDVKSRSTGVKVGSRLRHRKQLGTIMAFTVYHDSFMWTTQQGDYLYKAKVSSSSKSKPITFKLPANPSDQHLASDNKRLLTVDPKLDAFYSPCHDNSCSHACFVDDLGEALCLCPDNLVLEPSNRTHCVEPSQLLAAHHAAATVTPLIHIDHMVGPHMVDHGSASAAAVDSHTATHVDHMMAAPEQHVNLASDTAHLVDAPNSAASVVTPAAHAELQPDSDKAGGASPSTGSSSLMVWVIIVLAVLVAVLAMAIYRQGHRLPEQLGQLSVAFVGNRAANDKDRALLLLDADS